MKVLVIWDLHWLNVWKKKIAEDNFDKVIFLWDYVDSFIVPDVEMIQNLRDIIEYKISNMDKVVLLLWNHDIQYIWEWNRCSWYRARIAWVLWDIYKENLKLFKVFHEEIDNKSKSTYLFSHAWVTDWWEDWNSPIIDEFFSDWFYSYEDLNIYLETHYRDFLFQVSNSRGWTAKYSWPLWADKSETQAHWYIKWYTQVVGHTKVKTITYLPHIIYCDTLEDWDESVLVLNI